MPDMDIIQQLAADIGAGPALKLMKLFKDDTDKRILNVRHFLEKDGDVKDLRLQAHSLNGLCCTYGASTGGTVAMDLQDACNGDDPTLIARLAQDALDIIPADVEATMAAMAELAAQEKSS